MTPPFDQRRTLALAGILLHMAAVGVVMGVAIPLTGLAMNGWGEPGWRIGLVAAMPSVAIVTTIPLAPRLVRSIGAWPAMVGGCLLGTAALLLMPLLPNVPAWVVLRFLIGAGLALPWLLGETWLNALSTDRNRGRVLALYSAALFLGFAVGPQLLAVTGSDGWPPFLAAGGALFLAILPLLPLRSQAPDLRQPSTFSVAGLLRRSPVVAATALAAGFTEMAVFALLALAATRSGQSEAWGLTQLSAFLMGGIALQLPLGILSDRLPRRPLLFGLAVGGLLLALALPLAGGHDLLALAVCFLLGGALIGYYALGLAILGESFAGSDLAVANAGFILLYEVGSITGPAVGGLLIDGFPLWGLPAPLAAASALLCGVLIVSRRRLTRGDRQLR